LRSNQEVAGQPGMRERPTAGNPSRSGRGERMVTWYVISVYLLMGRK
jgi:hypothetical protein